MDLAPPFLRSRALRVCAKMRQKTALKFVSSSALKMKDDFTWFLKQGS